MKKWTTQAESRLAEYLGERAAREGFQGEDAAELKDDLRRHIHEELEPFPGEAIGLTQLNQVLGRLDDGYRPGMEPVVSPVASPVVSPVVSPGAGWRRWLWRFMSWTFGVVLPLLVLLFEMAAHFCGGVFFDPVPTVWHALLLATVPGLNAWLLLGGRGACEHGRGLGAGVALVVALFYGVLFLPILHFSIIALVAFGLGVLSLTPVLAAIQTWWIGRQVWTHLPNPARFLLGRRRSMVATVVVLLVLEGPALWTRFNLLAALADEGPTPAAITRLRWFHSERTLLKACYEGNRGTAFATDIAGWLTSAWRIPAATVGLDSFQTLPSERVRDVFFRVTGKPFNSLGPPATRVGRGLMAGLDPLEDVEFDSYIGGDEVAVRMKALDLAESRFDGHVDAVSRIGYGEWTMVFKNGARVPREARCQVRLPLGGRVSRLTLWVHGEPREAAFSTVGKVKAAYREVAVVQRRDPVLVTMVAPDTVMVQCFPVPEQGEMKIRLGVTAPLDGRRWELPRIIERNFGLAGNLEHALWLQGNCGFDVAGGEAPLASATDGPAHSLNATLKPACLVAAGLTWVVDPLPATPAVVWCEDDHAPPEERFLIREPVTVTRPAIIGKRIVVIDGSASMAAVRERVSQMVSSAPPGDLTLLLADDTARPVTAAELAEYRFSGGRDNEPALREAIRLAKSSGGGRIVWLHGPQAVKLSQSESLQQLLERGTARPVIEECALVPGPNRLMETLYHSGCLCRLPELPHGSGQLGPYLDAQRNERQVPGWQWRRAATREGLPGQQVWDHLARVWAAATVAGEGTPADPDARSALAANYQLVTPLSGAVVLETQAQYDAHGLTPGDPSASPQVPNIPEPATGLLILLTLTAAALRRRRAA
jgi:hypothetical protein